MVKKKKKKEEIIPTAIENKNLSIDEETLKKMSENINTLDIDFDENKTDTFYKLAIEKLFDKDQIETKTEFLNPAEVFQATKLQFIGKFADIPLLDRFISALERKRISLGRKGREEIILALQERHQEEKEMRKENMMMRGGII